MLFSAMSQISAYAEKKKEKQTECLNSVAQKSTALMFKFTGRKVV